MNSNKMINRIDHVSIAVSDPEKAHQFFVDLLGAVPGAGMHDENMAYQWQIYSLGDLSRLEIIHPTGPKSFLTAFLKTRKGGGVHHITLQTPDIHEAMARLDARRIPYFGYHEYADAYWKEIFIHPQHAFGVLIQLAEFNPADWLPQDPTNARPPKFEILPSMNGDLRLRLQHPGGGAADFALTRAEAENLAQQLTAALA